MEGKDRRRKGERKEGGREGGREEGHGSIIRIIMK